MDLFDEVESLGIEHDNHESDLYLPVNETTRALIKKYGRESVSVFRNQIDGKPWYDIAFAYLPWWRARAPKVGA